jgi:hypothetical protein
MKILATMKFASVLSVVSLLPTTLAFAPASFRSHVESPSSLKMSFIRDRFADRTGAEAEERSLLSKAFDEALTKGVEEGLEVLDGVSREEELKHYDDKVDGNFKYLPSKDMTGVDTHITRLCATMAAQSYKLHDGRLENYKLNTDDDKAEVILQEKQGDFQPTSPTFGACVSGDTLILCWRGTAAGESPTDLINDIAFSPTSSIVWRKHAKTMKIQGAMASLCSNDIVNHEEFLIEACKKHGIKEIVTTGHSLGGGIGQIAHTILRAQIQDENSPWYELKGTSIRSVVFSAPMTTVLVDNYTDETEKFCDELDENSCNLIFSNDIIPRAYGYLSFVSDFAADAVPKLPSFVIDRKVPSLMLKILLQKILALQKHKLEDNESFNGIVGVASTYIHPGNIVYYKDEKSEPRVLKDLGAYHSNTENKETFRSVKYRKVRNPIDDFMAWHMDIITGPGLSYDSSVLH